MRTLSIITIDANGRLTLPASVRNQLSLNGDDELALDCLQDGTVTLRKVNREMRFERWLNG
jgi:AbrB family looped-hinge helix DNA binding protein